MAVSSRLFLASWPPPAVQQALAELGRTLSARVGGRAVVAENIHLTLAFLGEVSAPLQQRLEAAIDTMVAGRMPAGTNGAGRLPAGTVGAGALRDRAVGAANGVGYAPALPATFESFALRLDRMGSFRTGVAWVGAQSVPPALSRLHSILSEAITALGIPLERRAFAAHLTLLRKARAPLRCESVQTLRWEVTAFRLVASDLDPGGSRYRCLREWPLSPPVLAS